MPADAGSCAPRPDPRPDPRRAIPRTDALLADPRFAAAAQRVGSTAVKAAIREAQDEARRGTIAPHEVGDRAAAALDARLGQATTLRAVVNATGVVLHTNLGRAALSPAARAAMALAGGPCDVEFDLADGRRARRGRGTLTALAGELPPGTGTLVVNNGAAAIALVAAALAVTPGRPEIVVSRGELVEIGDGFRIPELLEATGARLREVGTTNRTHVADYEGAIGPRTGFVLKVHPSNFRVSGFTSTVAITDLAAVCARAAVPLVADLGSGLLTPDPLLPAEPDATSALRAGAQLVTCSCDKLLGGPQGGLVLGEPDLVERVRRHPLARAVRVDKTTLAALEATLRGGATPTHRSLHTDADSLRARADRLAAALARLGVDGEVVTSDGAVGGGCAPGVALPGCAVALPQGWAAPLRSEAVVGRLEAGRLLLDVRCVPDAEVDILAQRVAEVARTMTGTG